ncbi:cutinase [Mycolicibacterium vaccae ATCC 25954]|uniref:Cutinase n=2 Tax=Mycolicibacterium vaccae TaxID=1810 RepID=K0UVW5_MYCVA|nr:cutinase [Mycolicibacterium vaccae 95051]EJZ10901.1 cutinase [Mycolicibacterium vaccae ATCC 25954]
MRFVEKSRTGLMALAAAVGAAAATVLTAGAASAQPACPDVHWIGAAGSGERAGYMSADAGMGRVVYKSYRDFASLVQQSGRTITAEAVNYPATEVPEDGGVLAWAGFMSSVDTGADALGLQYQQFVAQCPTSQVVLAGYSQGAMVVHRNLHALDASPNLAAALLVADGDRLPQDPTINLGSVTSVPGAGKGVAQDWPILAGAPGPLPVTIGARTISVCDLGDAVCDYDPDAEDEMNPAAVAVHTSYARRTAAMDPWTVPLYQLVSRVPAPAPAALPVQVAAGS